MLLEVSGKYKPQRPLTLKVDLYVLFAFAVSPAPIVEPYRWRCVDGPRTMLELTIERGSSAILAGTLVSYKESPKSGVPAGFGGVEVCEGIPTVANIPPPKGPWVFSDHNGTAVLHRHDRNFFLNLSSESMPTRCLRSGHVGFFVNESNLVGLGFLDLSELELQLLDKNFAWRHSVSAMS
jgi:hypothetical protein